MSHQFSVRTWLIAVVLAACSFLVLRDFFPPHRHNGRLIARNEELAIDVYFQERGEGTKPAIVVDPPSDVIRGLPYSPQEREKVLNEGTWLIMACAVWSHYDLQSVTTAVDVAEAMRSYLRVGICPYDDVSELRAWCQVPRNSTSPIWTIMRNGSVLAQTSGTLSRGELRKFLEAAGVVPAAPVVGAPKLSR